MKISTRARYGLRALVELAARPGHGPLTTKALAESIEVSAKYLTSICTSLRNAGILRILRSSGGGFTLSKDPAQLTVKEVYEVLEGPCDLVECIGSPEICDRTARCAARGIWLQLHDEIDRVFSGISIAELAQRHQQRDDEESRVHAGGRHLVS